MKKNFVSNKDESPRIFKSDFLEIFTKIHWSVPLFIYVPIILYFLYFGIFQKNIPVIQVILLFAAGFFAWTFTEYILHRFVFHFEPKSEMGKRIHWTFHGVHHDYPNDSLRLVMPPSVSIPLAIIFYFLFRWVIGANLYAPFYSGFVAGYLTYDITHYAVHHFAIKSKFWLRVKQHHMKHHYVEPSLGYGVSSDFWDKIFRTGFSRNEKIAEKSGK